MPVECLVRSLMASLGSGRPIGPMAGVGPAPDPVLVGMALPPDPGPLAFRIMLVQRTLSIRVCRCGAAYSDSDPHPRADDCPTGLVEGVMAE